MATLRRTQEAHREALQSLGSIDSATLERAGYRTDEQLSAQFRQSSSLDRSAALSGGSVEQKSAQLSELEQQAEQRRRERHAAQQATDAAVARSNDDHAQLVQDTWAAKRAQGHPGAQMQAVRQQRQQQQQLARLSQAPPPPSRPHSKASESHSHYMEYADRSSVRDEVADRGEEHSPHVQRAGGHDDEFQHTAQVQAQAHLAQAQSTPIGSVSQERRQRELLDVQFLPPTRTEQQQTSMLLYATKHADGKHESVHADGLRVVQFPNGTTKEIHTTGLVSVFFENGDVKQTYADGVVKYFFTEQGTVHVTYKVGYFLYCLRCVCCLLCVPVCPCAPLTAVPTA